MSETNRKLPAFVIDDMFISLANRSEEEQLVIAMMIRAIEDCVSNNFYSSVIRWMEETSEDEFALPFNYCCELLDIEPITFKRLAYRLIRHRKEIMQKKTKGVLSCIIEALHEIEARQESDIF